MKRIKRGLALAVIFALSLTLIGCNQKKAEYPTKDIELIIPWSAGGGTDVATRLYASYIEKELGVTINAVNTPGASGTVGLAQAKAANADGYTLALFTFDILTAEALKLADLSFKDFDLISTFSIQPTVYVALTERFPTMDDYVAYAKDHPGELKVATNGDGSVWHQAGAVANREMGIEVTYVPYDGSNEEVAALLGGHVDAIIISSGTVLEYLKDGSMTAFGVMTEDRIDAMPDVPTFKEQGIDAVYSSWRGLGVPKGTPKEVVDKLKTACKAAFDNQEFQDAAVKGGIDPWYLTSEEFYSFLESSYGSVESVLKDLGLA